MLHKKTILGQSGGSTDSFHKYKPHERFAIVITKRVGSMNFFYAITLWTALWLCWNTFAPVRLRFDALPSFLIWLFISNVIQLLLMPLIMVGQNLLGRDADLRAENDLEINQRSEIKIQEILKRLERQEILIKRLMEISAGHGK